MRGVRLVAALAIGALVIACGGGSAPSAAPGTPAASGAAPSASSGSEGGPVGAAVAAGGQLCGLLGPGDFAAQGIPGAGAPSLNGSGTTDAYCVYAGKSSGTGGIEFDAWVGPDADATYATVIGSSATNQDAKAKLPGVDAAAIDLNGEAGSVVISVQAGKLVFDIGFAKSANAEAQLLALAGLVLERGSALR